MKFPLTFFRVSGDSMLPHLKRGDYVLVRRTKRVSPGDIIVCQVGGRVVIKLFSHIEGEQIFLVGYNLEESTDSRHYGPISLEQVIGKVIHVIRR